MPRLGSCLKSSCSGCRVSVLLARQLAAGCCTSLHQGKPCHVLLSHSHTAHSLSAGEGTMLSVHSKSKQAADAKLCMSPNGHPVCAEPARDNADTHMCTQTMTISCMKKLAVESCRPKPGRPQSILVQMDAEAQSPIVYNCACRMLSCMHEIRYMSWHRQMMWSYMSTRCINV